MQRSRRTGQWWPKPTSWSNRSWSSPRPPPRRLSRRASDRDARFVPCVDSRPWQSLIAMAPYDYSGLVFGALRRLDALLGRPPPKLLDRPLLAQRAVLHPQLEQVTVGLTDHRPGADPELGHDPVAVEVGPQSLQVLLLLEHRDPLLQRVVRRRQRAGLRGVARGAVRPRQLVQPVEHRTRVADVSAHSGVGPVAIGVAVEPQVQLDQPGDVVDDVLRKAQLLQAL